MTNIKHNRFILSVPKDYTDEERESIKSSLAEAREKNEDILLSNDIGVHTLTEMIPAEETKEEEIKQVTQEEPKVDPVPTPAPTTETKTEEVKKDAEGTEGSSK